MPTYTLLGATGSTGSAILRCLLSQPPRDLTLKVLVRTKSKLLTLFPGLEQNICVQNPHPRRYPFRRRCPARVSQGRNLCVHCSERREIAHDAIVRHCRGDRQCAQITPRESRRGVQDTDALAATIRKLERNFRQADILALARSAHVLS